MSAEEVWEDLIRVLGHEDPDKRIDGDGRGILPYIEGTNRATFLVPPRKRRSLPRPLPGR
jgi:hypothetical protein